MFKFIKRIEILEKELRGTKDTIQDLQSDMRELNDKIDKLNAELFSVKNKDGIFNFCYPEWMTRNRHLFFQYSDGIKVHNIDIGVLNRNFDYYKIQINNNKAYICIRFVNGEESEEFYYIVDICDEKSIKVDNGSFVKFDSIEWIKRK